MEFKKIFQNLFKKEFTLETVYKNRKAFEKACKKANACETEYKKLISAKTNKEFLDVIYRNFTWVYERVSRFGFKYYDAIIILGNGLIMVKLNGKYGFIDKQGKEICEPKYDYVDDFNNGFAYIRLNGKYGFINEQGKEICEPKYDYVGYFKSGFAEVRLNDKYGFIDTYGNYFTFMP